MGGVGQPARPTELFGGAGADADIGGKRPPEAHKKRCPFYFPSDVMLYPLFIYLFDLVFEKYFQVYYPINKNYVKFMYAFYW